MSLKVALACGIYVVVDGPLVFPVASVPAFSRALGEGHLQFVCNFISRVTNRFDPYYHIEGPELASVLS